MKSWQSMAAALAASTFLVVPAAAFAQDAQIAVNIGGQDLGSALRQLSEQSGTEIIAPASVVDGLQSPTIKGHYTLEQTLDLMLEDKGLTWSRVDGAIVIRAGGAAANEVSAEIIVTGTRIRGVGPTGSPVIVLDREALDASGRTSTADIVQLLPQNFAGGANENTVGHSVRSNANTNVSYGSSVNLRGLGTASTLTLFDGNRPALGGAWGAFTDLSLVPSTVIDRIEILTDGASAIYGSDAVAGVVNIRFRNRFEGLEIRGRAATADGDFGEQQVSAVAGHRWTSGGIVLGGEYWRRDNLPASKRPFMTENLTPFGGPDYRSNWANPGTIIAANGQIFAIPSGQDGRNLQPFELNPGVFNRADRIKLTDILPRQRTMSVYGAADQSLGSGFGLFARALYADRRYHVSKMIFGPLTVSVPTSNPFYVDPIGTGEPVTVLYDPYADFGPEGQKGSAKALNAQLGITKEAGPWRIELTAGYGLQLERSQALNVVNRVRLNLALADTDPGTAFNVFGDGQVNNPATINNARGSYDTRIRYRVWNGALRIEGPLFSIDGRDAKLATGLEFRSDRLNYEVTYDLVGLTPMTGGIAGLPGKRSVISGYGELFLPLLRSGGFPGSFDISLAARFEHYSDVGNTLNPKVGARWEPVPGFALRASYGRSFRAPFFTELVGEANSLYQPLYLPDPQSPTGETLVLGLFGFAPNLGPEKATTWTIGADFKPRWLPGLSLSASWFNIDYRDRIASPSIDLFNFLNRRDIYGELIDESADPGVIASYYSNPNFANPLGVAPGQITTIIDARSRNLSVVTISGLDFDISYGRPLGSGRISASLSGSRLFQIDQQVTSSAPATDVLGTLGNPVKLRLRGQLGWSNDSLSVSLGWNRTSAYENRTVTPTQAVKPWSTFDLQIGFSVPLSDRSSPMRLVFGATNLFDTNPPLVVNRTLDSAFGYDPEQASAVGRMLSVQAIIKW